MAAGRDLGVGMIAGAQGDDLLFPKATSAASPLLKTAAGAAVVAAAQWPKAGMTAMETAAQCMMPAAAFLLLTTGRMPALPPMAVAPAPEMRVTTIMLSLLIIRKGNMPQSARNWKDILNGNFCQNLVMLVNVVLLVNYFMFGAPYL
jgi:hypothetical protein